MEDGEFGLGESLANAVTHGNTVGNIMAAIMTIHIVTAMISSDGPHVWCTGCARDIVTVACGPDAIRIV